MPEEEQLSPPNQGFFASLSREKRFLLFVLFPSSLLVYLIGAIVVDHYFRGAGRAFDIVFSISANVMAFAWCRLDSAERGYKLHRAFPYIVVIFGTLALIYYIFRSRGFAGGLGSMGWLILYAVSTYLAAGFVALIVLFLLVLTGVVPADVFGSSR